MARSDEDGMSRLSNIGAFYFDFNIGLFTEAVKPGNKGNFAGTRLEMLQSLAPEFIVLDTREVGNFWTRMLTVWWDHFPWRLPDDEEPPTDGEELKRLKAPPTEEEKEKHREIVRGKKVVRSVDLWWFYSQPLTLILSGPKELV